MIDEILEKQRTMIARVEFEIIKIHLLGTDKFYDVEDNDAGARAGYAHE